MVYFRTGHRNEKCKELKEIRKKYKVILKNEK